MGPNIEIQTLPLFPILDRQLIKLLSSFSPQDWEKQTIAKLWKVKDVASHLLDGNLRGLSISRDCYFGEKPENIQSHKDLIDFLNRLNISWTEATRRLSPQVLISLLESTGEEYISHLNSLDPFAEAIFPVSWAGQDSSPNWFHIAREYTEKFIHQQQIRDAVNQSGLLTKELYYPFLQTMMMAFPHTFKKVDAKKESTVSIEILSESGGIWSIQKEDTGWTLLPDGLEKSDSKVIIPAEIAWKLFSKSWNPENIISQVKFEGDLNLGKHALNIVGFMA
jgi:uncharacterized protein (TIGR03083 family)